MLGFIRLLATFSMWDGTRTLPQRWKDLLYWNHGQLKYDRHTLDLQRQRETTFLEKQKDDENTISRLNQDTEEDLLQPSVVETEVSLIKLLTASFNAPNISGSAFSLSAAINTRQCMPPERLCCCCWLFPPLLWLNRVLAAGALYRRSPPSRSSIKHCHYRTS